MMKDGAEVNQIIQTMTYKEAYAYLMKQILAAPIQKEPIKNLSLTSLLKNLDQTSQEKARFCINVEGLAADSCIQEAFDFPTISEEGHSDSHLKNYLPSSNLLFLNGGNSFQIDIENDIEFYKTHFPNAESSSLHLLGKASHAVHFQKKDQIIPMLADWIKKID